MTLKSKVIRGWGYFDQAAIRIRRRFAAALLMHPYGSLPYLFEGILSRGAPGAGAQQVQGQDHFKTGSGGRDLPRNLVFGADIGYGVAAAGPRVELYYLNLSADATWHDLDEQSAAPVLGQDFNFQGYVSPGIDTPSRNANDGNPCGLEGYTLIYTEQAGMGDAYLRWKNVSPDAADILSSIYSTSKTFSLSGVFQQQWHAVDHDDIPVIGGIFNRFKLQIQTDLSAQFWVAFVASAETRFRSGPISAGASNFRTLVP